MTQNLYICIHKEINKGNHGEVYRIIIEYQQRNKVIVV